MTTFAEEYQKLQNEVRELLTNLGRPADSVKILAVSKTFPASAIREAYDCGVRMFGENKIQELSVKAESLPADIEWHFIGHLQSNKAAKAVQYAQWIHSVDSVKLLQKLDRIAGELNKKPHILLEVNSGEAAKSGVDYDQIDELARAAAAAENLQWSGLMTMAPLCDDPAVWKAAFERLAQTRDRLEQTWQRKLPELSMGMTGDFAEAIQAGSTLIRIGSRLFGNRNYAQ
ncbi:MAG: YggS family pyridoxal phosphate-dependent enzyme [Lentisphaerae bacterium]|nr:YggS family pyridoxal phosphate-dependent enzyme [Lentisphaerota bacterium]